MGTSSGRRAPTTALWRAAKGAATRYLSPTGGGAVTAGEVAARYVAALGESGGQEDRSGLASWALTRKAAQNLGAWWTQATRQGLAVALEEWGLAPLIRPSQELLAQGVGAALVPADGGLEEVVARTALATVLRQCLAPRDGPGDAPPPAQLVRQFLTLALFLRLNLDLGESLEAAAPSVSGLRQGLHGLRQRLEQAASLAATGAPAPQGPGEWRGLPGWSWVSETLKSLLAQLHDTSP
jgi:hypothetical protein